MTDFILSDLYSQADAVWRSVNGWTQQEILLWLSGRGIVAPHFNLTDSYSFRSGIGIETTVRLTVNGQLFIYLGDHVFYEPANSK